MSGMAQVKGRVIVKDDPWSSPSLCLSLGLQLALQQLRLRYRGSILGYVWTMVYPLLLLLTYALVFSALFRTSDGAVSPLASFSSVFFAWLLISSTLNDSVYSISHAAALMHQTHFPPWILPFATTLSNLISFILSLPVVLAILFAVHIHPTWNLFLIVPLTLLLFCFSLGLCLLISLPSVFFRDMPHIVGIAVTMLFFLSPIFYTLEHIRDSRLLHGIVLSNPVSYFLEISRSCFLGSTASPGIWAGSALWALLTLAAGAFVFSRYSTNLGMRI